MKTKLILLCFLLTLLSCQQEKTKSLPELKSQQVKGWNILSSNLENGLEEIEAAGKYGINHLQLSHQLIMDLRHVRDSVRLYKTRKLMATADDAGIEKVFVWDHALYNLNYYPDKFLTEEGTIDLDNPQFWKWFKDDYRSMLDSLPGLDGIILTFIETGANVEDQYSEAWKTEAEKLANLVDSVASVVIDERKMDLYIRTFIYYKEELDALLGCVNQVQHPEVKIMTKEVPHDFFLTHPVSTFIEKFNKEVLIEYDLGHEYNGQGVIASGFPEITVDRWKYYAGKENVIGYVARINRFQNTKNINTPNEVNIYALKRIVEDTSLTSETIVEEFIAKKYGKATIPFLKDLFLETDEIITSVFYTLGTHTDSHSRLSLEREVYYSRHCSGKWMDKPEVFIEHGVNKKFHYWKDVVEHLSTAEWKSRSNKSGGKTMLYLEAPWIIDSGWVTPVDKMNKEYFDYIIAEKKYGVDKAKWALEKIESAKDHIVSAEAYDQLHLLYEKTHLTAQLYLYANKVWFGFRVYQNDPSEEMLTTIKTAFIDLQNVADEMKAYPKEKLPGQYVWQNDIYTAEKLIMEIKEKLKENKSTPD